MRHDESDTWMSRRISSMYSWTEGHTTGTNRADHAHTHHAHTTSTDDDAVILLSFSVTGHTPVETK